MGFDPEERQGFNSQLLQLFGEIMTAEAVEADFLYYFLSLIQIDLIHRAPQTLRILLSHDERHLQYRRASDKLVRVVNGCLDFVYDRQKSLLMKHS